MLLPATARLSTTRSLLCYSTRLLGSSKTDAKRRLQRDHSRFFTNLPFRLANGIRTRDHGSQRSSPCLRIPWAFNSMRRRFLTPNVQPTGTSSLLSCRRQSENVQDMLLAKLSYTTADF